MALDLLLIRDMNVDLFLPRWYARQKPSEYEPATNPFQWMMSDRLSELLADIKSAPQKQKIILDLHSNLCQVPGYMLSFVLCSSH
jgi:hypothetical protein